MLAVACSNQREQRSWMGQDGQCASVRTDKAGSKSAAKTAVLQKQAGFAARLGSKHSPAWRVQRYPLQRESVSVEGVAGPPASLAVTAVTSDYQE